MHGRADHIVNVESSSKVHCCGIQLVLNHSAVASRKIYDRLQLLQLVSCDQLWSVEHYPRYLLPTRRSCVASVVHVEILRDVVQKLSKGDFHVTGVLLEVCEAEGIHKAGLWICTRR